MLYNVSAKHPFTVNSGGLTFAFDSGDEILNGKTRDSNAYFLCKWNHCSREMAIAMLMLFCITCHLARYLFDLGISLKRVEVIADDYNAISETITRLSSQHDVVFTSGGIGKRTGTSEGGLCFTHLLWILQALHTTISPTTPLQKPTLSP
jgi:hypothetical protein